MKKILFILSFLIHLSFAATSAQIEQYLLVSHAEEELLTLEAQFSAMQNSFSKETNSSESDTYDMQMLSLRFKDYLQKHLSEDEMNEILQNYKNIVLLQFVSASSDIQRDDENKTITYIEKLKNTPNSEIRIKLVEKITHYLYSKEAMVIMFDELMKPLLQNGIGGNKINKELLESTKEDYLKSMLKAANEETLFASKDFTIEELETLLKIAKTSASEHESKAVFGGMAYALKEFFMSLASRYDVNKHQHKHTK